MEVYGKKVRLKPEEVSPKCPLDPAWAASMLRLYGPDHAFRSERLRDAARCVEVLKIAGYDVEITESEEAEQKNKKK